ncbi:MAG: hypothetical protein EKK63_15775 [Acinetobacter sp.]|uniref:phage antirepressor KilAC domain-containing protein n=1 Tax=Acinetobacter sp. TaxID=472 RepID=UPI000FA7D00A|nr:phage antirepressor KilAC domain-containing protein [Acinetobacter sp.]RUP37028.1 MAG: hypothetical protein EKK63_15775 [Acinetobacter sp.]
MTTEKIKANERIKSLSETIKEQAPAIEYVGEVLESNSAHTITTIAKELGMSGQKLNDLLCEKKVQYRHDGHYVLYAKYQNMGYTKTRKHTYTDKYGKEQTQIQTVWTEKGRQLIHIMFNPKLNAQ